MLRGAVCVRNILQIVCVILQLNSSNPGRRSRNMLKTAVDAKNFYLIIDDIKAELVACVGFEFARTART